jgi:hypothetical protein
VRASYFFDFARTGGRFAARLAGATFAFAFTFALPFFAAFAFGFC